MKVLQKCRVRMIGGTHIFQINGVKERHKKL